MTTIPIKRIAKGYYRATLKDAADRVLILPVQFHKQLTFAQLAEWPPTTDWAGLTYVAAPRKARELFA
jgi:hypothetical protein